jgi:hypothetical protein
MLERAASRSAADALPGGQEVMTSCGMFVFSFDCNETWVVAVRVMTYVGEPPGLSCATGITTSFQPRVTDGFVTIASRTAARC